MYTSPALVEETGNILTVKTDQNSKYLEEMGQIEADRYDQSSLVMPATQSKQLTLTETKTDVDEDQHSEETSQNLEDSKDKTHTMLTVAQLKGVFN